MWLCPAELVYQCIACLQYKALAMRKRKQQEPARSFGQAQLWVEEPVVSNAVAAVAVALGAVD